MKKIVILIALVFLFGCGKDAEINQLKIDFTTTGAITTNSTSGSILYPSQYLNFNVRNYGNCSSIVFAGYLETKSPNYSCFLELFNLTDSVVIPNSTISTNEISYHWIESQNLLNEFPEKDIDIAIRLRSEHEDTFVHFKSASLYINFD